MSAAKTPRGNSRSERTIAVLDVGTSKVAALISDNYAVEVHNAPIKPGQSVMLPLHQHALFIAQR